MKNYLSMLKDTFKDFGEDRAMRLAAAMAYYAIFAIGPMLFVMVTIAGWVLGDEAVRGQVQEALKGFVGEQSAKTIQSMMVAPKQGQNIITTVLGILALLMGASGLFGQLQDALNTIWEVQSRPGQGIWGFIRNRFLSMAMVLGLGFLLLISMILTTAVQALTSRAGQLLPLPDGVTVLLSAVAAFFVVTLFFALVYKVLPDVKIQWRHVWAGAIFTAILFTVGKFLLGLYLGKQASSSTYGAAGSVIVILLWIYYSSLILFLGAEFTQVYARRKGAAIVPTDNAVAVTEEKRAQQGMPTPERRHPEPVLAYKPSTAVPRRKTSFAALLGFGLLASWIVRRGRPRA